MPHLRSVHVAGIQQFPFHCKHIVIVFIFFSQMLMSARVIKEDVRIPVTMSLERIRVLVTQGSNLVLTGKSVLVRNKKQQQTAIKVCSDVRRELLLLFVFITMQCIIHCKI